jgi:hypothetical protein
MGVVIQQQPKQQFRMHGHVTTGNFGNAATNLIRPIWQSATVGTLQTLWVLN